MRFGAMRVIAALSGPAVAHETMIFETTADEDWCAVINEVAMPGDIIRLAPGDYMGPCVISRTPPEEQDEYTIVMSLDPENPARILYDGSSTAQLTVEGDQVMLLSLDFGPVPDEVTPVEILGHREIWVRYNRFGPHNGTAVKVSGAVDGLHVLDNDFESVALPVNLELGVESQSWVDFGYNRIRGASLGMRARGNWRGWVRENVLWEVQQGFDVQAVGDLEVRGNWVRFEDQGMELVSESVQFESNILHGGGQGLALGSEDSSGSYLVSGNSFVTETAPAVLFVGADAELKSLGNLSLLSLEGGDGNVTCASKAACWVDVDAGSYYPTQDPVINAGVQTGDLGLDFCGRERSEWQWVGGLEAACPGDPEVFDFDFKRNFRCTYADLSGANESCHEREMDTGDGPDTGGVGGEEPVGSCACSSQAQGVSGFWGLLGGVWVSRRVQRRRRSTRST